MSACEWSERFKKGHSLFRERIGLRFSFIDNEKKAYPLNVLCKVMQVSRSGNCRWKRRSPSAREQERAQLIPRVRGLHQESKATYSSRRMTQELKALGFRCGQTTEKVQGDNRQQPSVARCPQSFGLIFHSDRGSLYYRHDFQNLLKKHGILTSMSRKGDCWDKAVAESFFGSLKIEQVFGMRYLGRAAARQDIVDYIEMFYNSRHRHSSLGYMNPIEFEKQKLWEKAA